MMMSAAGWGWLVFSVLVLVFIGCWLGVVLSVCRVFWSGVGRLVGGGLMCAGGDVGDDEKKFSFMLFFS